MTPDSKQPPTDASTPSTKRPRGLAAVDPERRRAISAMGGRAVVQLGKRNTFNSETARAAGQKAAAKLHQPGGKAYRWNPETAKAASDKAVAARNCKPAATEEP